MKLNKKIVLSSAILVVLTTLIGYFTYMAIWVGDDIYYGFFWGDETRNIETIWDIFPSMNNHWMTHNGRYVAHWLVQLFIIFAGRLAFAVANACIYVACTILILRLARLKWHQHPSILLFIATMLVVAFRTKFSPSCQIGYIWMFTFSLAFLDIFFNKKTLSVAWTIPAAMFSFIAGWGQESFSAGIVFALLVYLFLHRKDITTTQWTIAFFYCVGALLLIIAPGNFVRMGTKVDDKSLLINIVSSMMQMVLKFRVTYLFALVFLYYKFRKKVIFRMMYQENTFLLNAMMVLFVFNLVVHTYTNRQLFGIDILALMLIVSIIRRHGLSSHLRHLGVGIISLYLIYIVVGNVQKLTIVSKTYDYLYAQYLQSCDGTVFCDVFSENSINGDESPTEGFDNSAVFSMGRLWKSQGHTKYFQVLPVWLKGKIDKQLDTQAVYLGRGAYLLINSKHNPAKRFLMHRYIQIGSFKRPYIDFPLATTSGLDFNIDSKHFTASVFGEFTPLTHYSGVDIEY